MWLVGLVSMWQAEAILVCSCGVRGLGVNDRFQQGVYFSWVLLRNEFAFSVERLDVVLLVRDLYRTHNQCGDTIEKSQAPDDGCINVRNMLSIEEVKYNLINCDIKLVSYSSTNIPKFI